MNLGNAIKICRQKRGLTQNSLAKQSSISIPHLCLLEKNKRDPSLSVINSIAAALKIPVSVLILLASQHDEITELSENQLEDLSRSIMGILDSAGKQESLF